MDEGNLQGKIYDIDHRQSDTVSSFPGDDWAAEGHDQPQQREEDRNSGLQRPHGRAHEAVPVGLFQAEFLNILKLQLKHFPFFLDAADLMFEKRHFY